METDWSVSAAGEDPVIEAGWADAATGLAWVDLRVDAETQAVRIAGLPEAASSQALADALARLNAPQGMLMTTKCDGWPLSDEERAELADALDTPVAPCGYGSYIDVLMAHPIPMADFLLHEEWARRAAMRCAALDHEDVRLDLIMRPARTRSKEHDDVWGYGLTVYHYAAGHDAQHAAAACDAAIRQTIPVLIAAADTLFVAADGAVLS